MLINLSNHHSQNWSEDQKNAANQLFKRIIDLPFPDIDPSASIEEVIELAQRFKLKCMKLFDNEQENYLDKHNAVHVMGEMTFTYNLVFLLHQEFIRAVVSATERVANEDNSGIKTSVFRFKRFRSFHIENNLVF